MANRVSSKAPKAPDAWKKLLTPDKIPAKWRKLLLLIPGYDPFAMTTGCRVDPDAAQLAIDFFPECLRHIEGDLARQPFVLEDWEKAILANLFGWKRLDAKGRIVRRYREAFLMVARKNGKTPFTAGIAIFVTFCEDELGQQNYIAAGEREQAGKLFRQAKGMVEQEPELMDRCRIYGGKAEAGQSRSIVIEEKKSFLRVISADAAGEHGGNTHLAIIDELHVQPTRELVDVLQTSFASENRKEPLFINITTAGHDRQSVCFEKYSYACKVRDNGGDPDKPGYDPAFLPVIYETPLEDDWTKEESWRKANPNLGVSVSLDYLRAECKRAQEIPDYENTFRQLHLDQWTQQAIRWLPFFKWLECGKTPVDPKALEGRECYAALDLASTKDTVALVLLFPDDGGYSLLPFFWVPEAEITRRSLAKTAPYATWVRHGFLKATGGDWCDYTIVEKDILDLHAKYPIRELAYDPKEASMLAQKLIEAGLKLFAFEQSFKNYNEPVKLFEQLVGQGKLRHGNHPVMNWMAENVALDRNVAGLRIPSKGKSGDKIDGIAAGVMALGRAMLNPASDDWYTPGCLRN
jgi:phage terminase large subunit-like protein